MPDDQGFSKRLLRVWLEDALRREDFPYSYRELTKRVNKTLKAKFHETTIRNWFNGTRPPLENIAVVADILRADRDYLAFGPKRVLGAGEVARSVQRARSRRAPDAPIRPSGPDRPRMLLGAGSG